jgi:hypothetical protein
VSSRGKKKTTFAKMNREMRQRERRQEKAVRKEARRNAPPAAEVEESTEEPGVDETQPAPEQVPPQ